MVQFKRLAILFLLIFIGVIPSIAQQNGVFHSVLVTKKLQFKGSVPHIGYALIDTSGNGDLAWRTIGGLGSSGEVYAGGHLANTDDSTLNADSLSQNLRNEMALKLAKGDTAAMLGNYFNQVGWGLIKIGHTVGMDSLKVATIWKIDSLAALISGGGDGNNYTTAISFSDNILTTSRSGLSALTAAFDSTRWHTKLYYDGIYQHVGSYLTSFSETDPTVSAIIKAIPVTTNATTNKYYYWNNGSIDRRQISYSDISGTPTIFYPVTSVFSRTGDVVATSGDYNTNQVTENTNLYYTNTRARNAFNLTTIGTTGVSTYNNTTGTWNIPNYTYTLPTASASVLGAVKVGTGLSISSGTLNVTAMDTTGKWLQDAYVRNDSIFKVKNGTETFIERFYPYNTNPFNYINIASIPNQGNHVINGLDISYVSGLIYHVSSGTYMINQIIYTYAGGNVTLAVADSSLDRQDAIIVTTSSTLTTITGDPSATPEIPTADPSIELAISSAYIAGGATTPSNINQTIIRDEGSGGEWTISKTLTSTDNYATNPYHGSISQRITAAANNQYVEYTAPTIKSKLTFDNLVFFIRNNSTLTSARNLTVNLFNGATRVGANLNITTYGYSKTILGSYQTVAIPMSAFTGADAFNIVRVTNTGTGGIVDVQVDYIQLQNGVVGSVIPTGTLTNITATNNYGQAWTIINPTTVPNLSLVLDTATKFATQYFVNNKPIPTLQQVTNVGFTTTTQIQSSSPNGIMVIAPSGATIAKIYLNPVAANYQGELFLSDTLNFNTIHYRVGEIKHNLDTLILPDNTRKDTVATLHDIRSGSGIITELDPVYLADSSNHYTKVAANAIYNTKQNTIPNLSDTAKYLKKIDSTIYYPYVSNPKKYLDSASVPIPTLQQVLTAGSTLTGDNNIDGNNHLFELDSSKQVTIVTNTYFGGITYLSSGYLQNQFYVSTPDMTTAYSGLQNNLLSSAIVTYYNPRSENAQIYTLLDSTGNGILASMTVDSAGKDTHIDVNDGKVSLLGIQGNFYVDSLKKDVGTKSVRYNPTTHLISYADTTSQTITGTGNTNEIAYFTGSTALGSLAIATYPSLTELSYVKGVTSAVQSQINGKQASGSYELTTNKDATGGYVGLNLFKINFKNAANTFTNFLTNATTASRTYTFPDKDITVAGLVDITGTNSGTNTGDNSVNSNYSGLVSNATHTGDATGSTALTVVKINGTSLAGLPTGILKNTTGTGVPSIATLSDMPIDTLYTVKGITSDITTHVSHITLKLDSAYIDSTVKAISGSIITNRLTAQTGAVSLTAYTVGASDASFLVSANVLVTTATLHSFTATCTYTDEGNTSRVVTLNFSTLAGALTPTIANAGGAAPYEGVPLHIRCKASTTITVATTGTFSTVVYNFEQMINKLN